MKAAAVILVLFLASYTLAELVPTISLQSEKVFLGYDKVKLNWKIENTDNAPVLLFKYGTPLEGTFRDTLTTDMFEIVHKDSGIPAIYTGILMKRDLAVSKPEHFEIIRANSEISGEIILTDAYHFTEEGEYTIRLVTSRSNLINTYPLVSNEISIFITGSTPLIQEEFRNTLAVKFAECSSSEQSIVNSAISKAKTASQNALNYLNKGCTPTYVTWFGTYSSSNYNTVKNHFSAINSALESNNFGINCGCNQAGTYAYVYPTDTSKTIYLCPVFWDASTSAYVYNSQPGTLTHEMSHFNAVAGTEDYQYGTTGCKNLAQTNPSRAIANADSHEYFQESNPSC